MRIVADTNIVISALFWRGAPRRILDAARDGIVEICTSEALLAELEGVLVRKKFSDHIAYLHSSVRELVSGFTHLAIVVEPGSIDPVIERDPDDDKVLACALAAGSDIIVSGDDHLLSLKKYKEIRIMTANEFLEELSI